MVTNMCVLWGHLISWWRNRCWCPCACKYLGIIAWVHWQSYIMSKCFDIWGSWWVGNNQVCCLYLCWWWRQWNSLSLCLGHMSRPQVPEQPVSSSNEACGVWWQGKRLNWGFLGLTCWWDRIPLECAVELKSAGVWSLVVHCHHC